MTEDDVHSWTTLFQHAPDDVSEATVREVLADHRQTD